jgi:hypothetical protein
MTLGENLAFDTLQAYLEIVESKILRPSVPAEGFSIVTVCRETV